MVASRRLAAEFRSFAPSQLSGAVAAFAYGNGVSYSATPNVRQLPLATQISHGILNETYAWDEYDASSRRLTRLENDSGKTQLAYLYDANGNARLRDASGLGLAAYAYHYDRANRLLEVRHPTNAADVKARYQYDGHARRVLIEEDGEQRVQVYSQAGQYLFEEPDLITDASFTTGTSQTGKPRTRYQYLGNMLIAKSSGIQTTYLHTDHLGSPIAESSAGPTVEVTHLPLHEPYGAPSNGTYLDGPGYTGHVVDGLTGLSYMQARYYDPVAGRFLGVDPVGVDLGSGGNFGRYAYANNSPYGFVDPDGRVGVVAVLAAAAVGCAASQACTGIVLGTALILASQGLGDSTTTSPDMSGGFYGEMINESAEPDVGDAAGSDGDSVGTPEFEDIEGNKTPFRGDPGSTVRAGTGSRTYGEDGFPETDRDTPHPDEAGCGSGDHCHDWGRPSDGGPPTHTDRGPPRLPQAGDPPKPRGANVPPPKRYL